MTTLTVESVRHDSTLFAGLRQAWIDGAEPDTGMSFDLTCGAGLGSPYLVLSVKLADGTKVSETIDIRPLLTAWVDSVVTQ
jgi:hypothetical protein